MIPLPIKGAADGPEAEAQIQSAIRLALGQLPDVRIWRNNVGSGVIVKVSQLIGILTSKSGGTRAAIAFLKTLRPVTWGLAVGSSDLIGIVAPHGRLLSIEVKSAKGIVSKEQEQWIAIVERFGGVAGPARSVDEAMELVERARTCPSK
jgi:hypothetical protein